MKKRNEIPTPNFRIIKDKEVAELFFDSHYYTNYVIKKQVLKVRRSYSTWNKKELKDTLLSLDRTPFIIRKRLTGDEVSIMGSVMKKIFL